MPFGNRAISGKSHFKTSTSSLKGKFVNILGETNNLPINNRINWQKYSADQHPYSTTASSHVQLAWNRRQEKEGARSLSDCQWRTEEALQNKTPAPGGELQVSRVPLPGSGGCWLWQQAHGLTGGTVLHWQDKLHTVRTQTPILHSYDELHMERGVTQTWGRGNQKDRKGEADTPNLTFSSVS